MRLRIALSLLCVLLLYSLTTPTGWAQSGAWSLQILEADAQRVLLELTIPSFESDTVTHDGIQYLRLRVAEWGSWGQPGQPQMPMHSVLLGMPWPGKPQISVIQAESETFERLLLYPAPTLELGGTEDAPQVVETFVFDSDAYSADTFYPGPLAEAASIGFLRDQPVFQLRLYPLQYNPLRRELRFYRRLKVQVTFPKAPLSLTEADRGEPSPVFERILRRTLLNYDSLPRPPAAPPPPPSDASIIPLDTHPQAKLRVEQSGIYHVTYEDLQANAPDLAQGDPRLLELSNRGAAVPILFDGEDDGTFDPGDSFLFYGQDIHSDYTRQNVYWLQAGSAPGLRMDPRDGTPGTDTPPEAFSDHRHYEEDHTYWRAVPNGDGKDHWFWDKLVVSSSTPVSADYAFGLYHIATNGPNGQLRLMLHGLTSGDHLTQLYLNGTPLLSPAEQAWSGQVEKLYEIPVTQSLFVEGTNQLRVENILPGGSTSSGIYVNWFEVTYQDTYVTEDNRLLFSAPSTGTYTFELTDFSTNAIKLFDITNPAVPVLIINHAVEPDGDGYRLRFSDDATANQKYLAQGTDQLPAPSVQLDEPSAWKSPDNGATYLIITHPSFYDALQPLAAYHSSQGETVVVVKTEDIYDEFNDGIYAPQAIRSFLEYAYENWSPQPVYVLLVGDASLDPKNNRGSSLPDLLPAYYVDISLFGQSPNDSWYAKVHGGDDYPDVILGRIPARPISDITTVVDKVQMYEESPPPGDWVRRAVLVADDGEPTFVQDMDNIAAMLPESMTPIQMYDYDPSTSVQNEVSTGALLFAYSGHGSTTGWGTWPGGHHIFDQYQMQDMWNGDKLPFMTVANCLNGLFDEYNRPRAMAEEFLLLDNKGGIASWAPASLGFPTSNSVILEELYQALLVDDDLILGSAATTARIEAHLSRPDLPLSLFEVFTYFGDPAVRLNLPATLELSGQDFPDPVVMGELLTYTLTYTVSGADQARGLTLVDTLPQHLIYQSASPPPSSINGQTLTWDLGDTPQGSNTLTVTAQVETSGLAHEQILQNQARLYDVTGGDQVVQIETTVHDSPIAGLLASSDSPTELGNVTTLSATVTAGTNVVYTWDFGDGSPLQNGSPIQHTYPAIGTYIAQVTATNGVSSQSQTTTVFISDAPPLASFNSSSPDLLGQTTTFQSTSTGTNLSYQWNFGDGSPPVSSQVPTINYVYTDVGSYDVVLTATNSAGSSTAHDVVQILLSPVASFSSSSPDELGQVTSFINTSQSGGDDEENLTYVWDFGDGTFSADKNPTHTYSAVGTYLVSLTVNNRVASDTFSDTVIITDVPISGLEVDNDSPTLLGSATTLSATTATGTNIVYTWDFGDESPPQTGSPVQHTYPAVGTYIAQVTAMNSVNSQSQTTTVTINDVPPMASFISSSPDTPGQTTTFQSTSTGTNLSYQWNFGDGSPPVGSQAPTITHVYTDVGSYGVVLTATNSAGSSTAFGTVEIVSSVPLYLPLIFKNNSP